MDQTVRKFDEYGKGDIYFEICVERSSTNEKKETITLWKNQDGKFQVTYFREGDKPGALEDYRRYEDESGARIKYEDSCDENGCSPYPEAKEYYKKKGISLP